MCNRSVKDLFWMITILLLAAGSNSSAQSQNPALDRYSPDSVLIKFKPGTPAASQAEAHRGANGSVNRVLRGTDVLLVRVPSGLVNRALAAYSKNPNIEYAEKNSRRVIYLPSTNEGSETISTLTFDNFDEQWNLHNTGQEFGLTLNFNGNYLYPSYEGAPDADIDAPEAWDISQGNGNISIAVLDSGVACDHLDLAGKCIDEMSFVADKGSPPKDVLGHGTHVAGIAAASTDNNIGIAGVGWNTTIAALKVCWEDTSNEIFGVIVGVCDDADVIEAINYAVEQQYPVISMSFAGYEFNTALRDAIDAAWNSGIILVAAAGNIYTDDILYPAGYDNVISVGSSDHQDNLSAFSNHGIAASVLAPGSHIVSTVPGNFCGQLAGVPSDCYDTKSGTSMAVPHVAGLAALMLSEYPTASNSEIRTAIEASAEPTGALGQNMLAWSTHGRINMQATLATDPTGPGGSNPTFALVQQPLVVRTVSGGRGTKLGYAEVTIIDDLGGAVAGAEVQGTFTGSFNESPTATTGSNGVAIFESGPPKKKGISFQFCVTSVSSALLPPDITGDDCATF